MPEGVSLSARLGGAAERLSATVERSRPLDRAGKAVIGTAGKWLRPGRTKEVLSGTWLGHPLHPLLTDLPIGAWTSAWLLDLVGGKDSRRAADLLIAAGVVAAVPTAISGLSDYSDVVAPEDRAVGFAHAVGNVVGVGLYAASFIERRRGRRGAGVALSTLGAAALTAAGFLGGHLAYRRGVGVDQTAFRDLLSNWTPALDAADLEQETPQVVSIDGTEVLFYRAAGTTHALANRCSHRGGPLGEGAVEDGTVTCPWHGSTFSLADGSIVRGPATAPQPCFETRVVDGRVEVRSRRQP